MAAEVGLLFAIVTMVSWGTADFFAKKAVDKVGNSVALLINQAVALGPICIFAFLTSPLPELSLDLVLLIILTGSLSLTGYFYLYKGFRKGSISVVSPISASWFVITALVAAVAFSEALTPLHIGGIGVVFIGVFLVSTNLSELKHSIRQGRNNGVVEALISMVTWGFAFALIKPIVEVTGPIMALLFTRVVADVVLVAWMKVSKTKFSFPPRAFIVLLLIAGLLDALGFAAYNIGVSTQYVSIISPIAAA
jgi:drug/metabolite transporter (DMT)-like permease